MRGIQNGGIYVFEHGDYSDHFENWYWHPIEAMTDVEVRFLLNDHLPNVRKNVLMQRYPVERNGKVDLWAILLQEAGFVVLNPALRIDKFSEEYATLPELTEGYNEYALSNLEAHIRGRRLTNMPQPGRVPPSSVVPATAAAEVAVGEVVVLVSPPTPPVPDLSPIYVPDLRSLAREELEKWRVRFHELEALRDGGPVSAQEQSESETPVYRCITCGMRRDARYPPHKCRTIQELEAIQGSWPHEVPPL